MKMVKENDHCLSLNVGVVARGGRCLSIMRRLQSISPLNLRLKLAAIAAVSQSVSCNKYAGEMSIELFEDPMDLLQIEYLDLILELTGDAEVLAGLIKNKPASIGVLDRQASLLLFEIAAMYDRVARSESEINLASSFASALLEASPDGVLVIDRDFNIVNSNNNPILTGGIEKQSMIGQTCHEVLHGSSKPCLEPKRTCPTKETLRTGKPARTVHEITGPDGPRICHVTTYPIQNPLGEIAQFVVTVRDMTKDLTERIEQRAQAIKDDLAQFVQDDRLASLGRLVASVCHEINNPITSIVTFNKLILTYIRDGGLSPEKVPEVERYLELSVREALRCGGIVANLLTFARQKSVEAKEIDLHEMVHTILLLTNHQMEIAQIEPVVNLPKGAFTAWGDYAQIQQCLMNLVFNAIDAMPDGGELKLEGEIEEEKNQIWLAVSDTGCGISHDELPKIFEPFYSTKTDGKGVGLGLSMVYGIISQHKGAVEVDSGSGKGATFRIKLPRTLPDEIQEETDFRSY